MLKMISFAIVLYATVLVDQLNAFSLVISVRGTEKIDVEMESPLGDILSPTSVDAQPNITEYQFSIDKAALSGYFETIRLRFGVNGGTYELPVRIAFGRTDSHEIRVSSDIIFQEFHFSKIKAWRRRANSDPLSTYLLTQRLKNEGAFDISTDAAVHLAHLEYLAAFSLICDETRNHAFLFSQQNMEDLTIKSILDDVSATGSGGIKSTIEQSWQNLKVPRSEIVANITAMPFCYWSQYGLVKNETDKERFAQALAASSFFLSVWNSLTQDERGIVLAVHRINQETIEGSHTYLVTVNSS